MRWLSVFIINYFKGLLVALQNASPKSLVVVFTDNGSKDLMLERDIVRLRKTKEIEVGVKMVIFKKVFFMVVFVFRCSSC